MKTLGAVRTVSIVFFLAVFPCLSPCAPQVDVRLSPEIWIPFGNHSNALNSDPSLELYSLGYGLSLTADLGLHGFLSPYVEASGAVIPLNNVATSLSFGQGGVGISVYAFPTPRLMLRGGGSAGMSYASVPKTSLSDAVAGMAPYWKARAEAGYRFSPTFSILGDLGYSQLLGTKASIYQGISAGLVFNLGIDKLGGGSEGITTAVARQETLFPIAYYKSEKAPIGYVELTNGESAEIRDVKVSFGAGTYTSRDADCGSYPIIRRGGMVEVPIYANFNDKVLGFSETTKIQGDLKVEYKILDASKSARSAVAIVFNNRNAATWADERVVGAFVSPQDPSMLELSKYIAGLVRVHARPEIDKFLQYGMGLFEGLRVYGVVWTADPNIPYSAARMDATKLAYIQYPYQTLSYKSGDSDAVALTIAEALESVAVPAAIAALPEDVIVAFPLDMSAAKARTAFANVDDFIFQDDKAWVPLRASLIRDGFLRAWQAGAQLWKSRAAESPRLVPIEDAWKEYSPIALTDVDFKPSKPSEEAVSLAFENVLGRFVTAEVEPRAKRLIAAMQGGGTGRQLNGLGILYAQYGLYEEAKAEFEKAVALNHAPALVNLANVAFLLKDYEASAANFEKALKAQGDNKAALIGLARARYELDSFAEADDLFARVKSMDPALADQYAYLASKVDASTALRASSAAADRGGGMTWDQDQEE
jgi:tetratricopeptide (TPR) repeat protein